MAGQLTKKDKMKESKQSQYAGNAGRGAIPIIQGDGFMNSVDSLGYTNILQTTQVAGSISLYDSWDSPAHILKGTQQDSEPQETPIVHQNGLFIQILCSY